MKTIFALVLLLAVTGCYERSNCNHPAQSQPIIINQQPSPVVPVVPVIPQPPVIVAPRPAPPAQPFIELHFNDNDDHHHHHDHDRHR